MPLRLISRYESPRTTGNASISSGDYFTCGKTVSLPGVVFLGCFTTGSCSSLVPESSRPVLTNAGGFGAFWDCLCFFFFFFFTVFFSLSDSDPFLGCSSSSLESINSGDLGTFLGYGVLLALFLLWRLITTISST